MPIDPQNLARWRLILGKSAEEPLQQMGNCVGQSILGGDQTELDEALEAIYSGDEIDKNEWEEGDKRVGPHGAVKGRDRKSTRLNSSHLVISYAVFCLKKNKQE